MMTHVHPHHGQPQTEGVAADKTLDSDPDRCVFPLPRFFSLHDDVASLAEQPEACDWNPISASSGDIQFKQRYQQVQPYTQGRELYSFDDDAVPELQGEPEDYGEAIGVTVPIDFVADDVADSVADDVLSAQDSQLHPIFFHFLPEAVPGVLLEVLHPHTTGASLHDDNRHAQILARKFVHGVQQFKDVSRAIANAVPDSDPFV